VRQRSFFTLINDITDRDEQWGPLLFLRPPRHVSMGWLRSAALAVLLGGLFGMLGSIVLALTARGLGRPLPPVYIMPAALTAIYFLVGRFTVAAAWNRRARQLVRPD
jgi:hypothetical protein